MFGIKEREKGEEEKREENKRRREGEQEERRGRERRRGEKESDREGRKSSFLGATPTMDGMQRIKR